MSFKRNSFFIGLLLVCSFSLFSLEYGVASKPWQERYGSQRCVVEVKEAGCYSVTIPWRLKKYPQGDIIVTSIKTGEEISQRSKGSANRFEGKVYFEAKEKGAYAIYYLPYKPDESHGWSKAYYLPYRVTGWVPIRAKKIEPIKIEYRTSFDNSYPMEIVATPSERQALESTFLKENPSLFQKGDSAYMLFAEDRDLPIRMKKYLPTRWLSGERLKLTLEAQKNEYYAFQIGLLPLTEDLKAVKVRYLGFPDAIGLSCFNLEGIDPKGNYFTKEVNVPKGVVQPLWIGMDIPKSLQAGSYRGKVEISALNGKRREVEVEIHLSNKLLADRGDSEPWRHSRLRWLNSTLGLEDRLTGSYTAVTKKKVGEGVYELSLLGRKMLLGEKGLPLQISTQFPRPYQIRGREAQLSQPIFSQPLELVLKKNSFPLSPIGKSQFQWNEENKTKISWKTVTPYEGFQLLLDGELSFDGHSQFNAHLRFDEAVDLSDVILEMQWDRENAKEMMGFNLPGTSIPNKVQAIWGNPWDSFWMGSVDAGLLCELLGASYSGPMLNLYRPQPPASWHNSGKGFLSLIKKEDCVLTQVKSGSRSFKKGDSIDFTFALIITPVKPLDSKTHFHYRYFHNPLLEKAPWEKGINVVNLHHANPYNPYINYPFIVPESTKEFVQKVHKKGAKVKLYYTVRELSNMCSEIWALRSLGNEILADGRGGGFLWLREHFEDDYDFEWYAHNGGFFDGVHSIKEEGLNEDLPPDAAILTSGNSRWYNYYVEGLNWMLKNYDIDGLYLDDVAFDRSILARIRRVMEANKPDCLIDLHSNTGFSKGPLIQYLEFFPYIDRLWFGESFHYERMNEESWLVEVSGIPFGVMGEMLFRGGNPYRGAVFGMTSREAWVTEGVICNPKPVWEVFDQVNLSHSEMIGYWEKDALVTTSHHRVKATLYYNKQNGKMLVVLGSWLAFQSEVSVNIDWSRLGLNPTLYRAYLPEMEGIQNYKECNSVRPVERIAPNKGAFILFEPLQ